MANKDVYIHTRRLKLRYLVVKQLHMSSPREPSQEETAVDEGGDAQLDTRRPWPAYKNGSFMSNLIWRWRHMHLTNCTSSSCIPLSSARGTPDDRSGMLPAGVLRTAKQPSPTDSCADVNTWQQWPSMRFLATSHGTEEFIRSRDWSAKDDAATGRSIISHSPPSQLQLHCINTDCKMQLRNKCQMAGGAHRGAVQ